MLSQQEEYSRGGEAEAYQGEPEFDDIYVKGYKRTDIFNLAPDVIPYGKRQVVDRNRSSLFKSESSQNENSQMPPKKDRMASDIFFGGNVDPATRFGAYQPSNGNSRRSSAAAKYEADHHEQTIAQAEHHEQAPRDTLPPSSESRYYSSQPDLYSDASSKNLYISNVFEGANQSVSLRGARRHYAQHQPASDIFFQNNSSEPTSLVARNASATSFAAQEQPQWVPSVKMSSQSTSFSNIFGGSAEIDSQNRADLPSRSPKKVVAHQEKLSRTFGVSSESGNRDRRGKGGRRDTSTSQIWF